MKTHIENVYVKDVFIIRSKSGEYKLAFFNEDIGGPYEILVEDKNIFLKYPFDIKVKTNSFSFYRLEHVLGDMYSIYDSVEAYTALIRRLLDAETLKDYSQKIKDDNMQKNIDIVFDYLSIPENLRITAKEKIRKKLLEQNKPEKKSEAGQPQPL